MEQADRDARTTEALTALGVTSKTLQSVNVSIDRLKRAVVVLTAVFALALFVGLPPLRLEPPQRTGCPRGRRL